MLKRFDAAFACRLSANFAVSKARFETARYVDVNAPKMQEFYERFISNLQSAHGLCVEIGLTDAAKRYALIMEHLHARQVEPAEVSTEAQHAREVVEEELLKLRFLYVPESRVEYLDRAAPFGPRVQQKFRSATYDLLEAGNCLAVDCNTAAVFHLMRAVEWGLRALCAHLGFHEVVERYDRSGLGQHEYRPIEYSTWDKILGQLRPRIDERIATIENRLEKQSAQEFYLKALQELMAIKDAWRNHVMHTRVTYEPDDVIAIWSHVKRLMVTLSERVEEA
jgi:hypothetical protein